MRATLALMLLLLSAGGLRAQVRLTETLNKAILEEESQHNLPAAVTGYQQVVAALRRGEKDCGLGALPPGGMPAQAASRRARRRLLTNESCWSLPIRVGWVEQRSHHPGRDL